MESKVINIDFDGTCVTHAFPSIGKNIGAEFVLRKLVENGHKLILFTMRCDHDFEPTSNSADIITEGELYLTQAVNWFKTHNIPLYGIQTNPDQHTWTSSPKSYAHYIIDDSALGCSLLKIPEISSKPLVDWIVMAFELFNVGLLKQVQADDCLTEIKEYFNKTYSINLYY